MQLTPEELREIMELPMLGILATVNLDGSPQATPIWYDYDGQAFNVTSFANRVKVRNIRNNPRVSLIIVDTVNYGEPLTVNGTAKIIEEGAQAATQRMAIRYQGEKLGRVSAAHLAGKPRVIIRIKPKQVLYDVRRGRSVGSTATREDITG